ncbi:MAG: TonB-dependent receptor [Bacteroidota bacterium]
MPLLRLLAALLAGLPFAVSAQPAALQGAVTDAETRAPLQGVSVALYAGDALQAGTSTDADGAFLLRRVAPGAYTLRLQFVGYAPTEAAVELRPGATTRVSVALAVDTTALGDVFVERAAPGGAAGTSAGFERISAADIEDVPAPGTSGDLASYLQTSTAVTAVGDRGGQLYVRGGAPSQTLVRLDGMRLSRPFHVLGFFSAVPSEIIDEVDLYTAAYPARHGGRLSSVLDVRARGGSKERVAASVGVAPALSAVHLEVPVAPGRVSALVSVRESLIEQVFRQWAGQRLPYQFGDAFGKVDALLGAQGRASVSYVRSRDRGDIGATFVDVLGNRELVDQNAADSLEVQWEEEALGAQAAWFPSFVPLRVKASVSTHRSASGVGPETLRDAVDGLPDTERRAGVSGTEAMLDATLTLGRAEVRLGAALYDARVRYRVEDRFTDLATGDEDYAERALYAEADVPLAAGVAASAGLRVERYPAAQQTAISPSVRLRWTSREGVLDEVALAAGVHHQGLVGVQDERDVGDVFTALVPVDSAQALPRAEHVVASVRGSIPGLRVAAEAYAKRFPDLLVARLDPAPSFSTVLDPGAGDAVGVDVRLEHRRALSGDVTLSLRGGYAYARVTYETERAGTPEAFPPPHDQRHAASGLARVDVGPFALYAVGQIHSGFPYTPSAGFDQYVPVGGGGDVSQDPGTTRVIYGARGSRRLPTYARLDVWGERSSTRGRITTTLRAGVINVLDRDNVFYFDLFTLRRANQLPFFPSIGLKVEVR